MSGGCLNMATAIIIMPAKKTKTIESKTKKREKDFALDIDGDIGGQFLDYWTDKQSDTAHSIYLDPETEHGVKKVLYSRLPTLDSILALKNESKEYGLPLNKIFEVFGPPDSGKTTLLYYYAALFIKERGFAIFVDFEHKFSATWFKTIAYNMGLTDNEIKRLILIENPEHFEWFIIWLIKKIKKIDETKRNALAELSRINNKKKMAKIDEEMKKKYETVLKTPFIILVDSVAAIYTKAEVEHEEEDKDHVAELARGFAEKLSLVRKYLGYSDTLLVFANQIRDKISIGGMYTRPGTKSTPGGNAWKHNCDARIKVAKESMLRRTRKGETFVYGTQHIFKVVKNQLGVPPFRETKVKMLYDRGYFSFHSVLERCAEVGIIKKVGNRYRISKDIEFEESSADDFVKEKPKVEEVLHEAYRKYMRNETIEQNNISI